MEEDPVGEERRPVLPTAPHGPRRRRRGSGLVWLAVALVLGILVLSLVLAALPEFDHSRSLRGPSIARNAEENLSVSFLLLGSYAPPVNLSGCPPGEAPLGSNWTCEFTVWSNSTWPTGVCNQVIDVYEVGARESSLSPVSTQTVCPGAPATFSLGLYVDPRSAGPIQAEVHVFLN